MHEQPLENVEYHFVCHLANDVATRQQIFPGPVFFFHGLSQKGHLGINTCSLSSNSMSLDGENKQVHRIPLY